MAEISSCPLCRSWQAEVYGVLARARLRAMDLGVCVQYRTPWDKVQTRRDLGTLIGWIVGEMNGSMSLGLAMAWSVGQEGFER